MRCDVLNDSSGNEQLGQCVVYVDLRPPPDNEAPEPTATLVKNPPRRPLAPTCGVDMAGESETTCKQKKARLKKTPNKTLSSTCGGDVGGVSDATCQQETAQLNFPRNIFLRPTYSIDMTMRSETPHMKETAQPKKPSNKLLPQTCDVDMAAVSEFTCNQEKTQLKNPQKKTRLSTNNGDMANEGETKGKQVKMKLKNPPNKILPPTCGRNLAGVGETTRQQEKTQVKDPLNTSVYDEDMTEISGTTRKQEMSQLKSPSIKTLPPTSDVDMIWTSEVIPESGTYNVGWGEERKVMEAVRECLRDTNVNYNTGDNKIKKRRKSKNVKASSDQSDGGRRKLSKRNSQSHDQQKTDQSVPPYQGNPAACLNAEVAVESGQPPVHKGITTDGSSAPEYTRPTPDMNSSLDQSLGTSSREHDSDKDETQGLEGDKAKIDSSLASVHDPTANPQLGCVAQRDESGTESDQQNGNNRSENNIHFKGPGDTIHNESHKIPVKTTKERKVWGQSVVSGKSAGDYSLSKGRKSCSINNSLSTKRGSTGNKGHSMQCKVDTSNTDHSTSGNPNHSCQRESKEQNQLSMHNEYSPKNKSKNKDKACDSQFDKNSSKDSRSHGRYKPTPKHSKLKDDKKIDHDAKKKSNISAVDNTQVRSKSVKVASLPRKSYNIVQGSSHQKGKGKTKNSNPSLKKSGEPVSLEGMDESSNDSILLNRDKSKDRFHPCPGAKNVNDKSCPSIKDQDPGQGNESDRSKNLRTNYSTLYKDFRKLLSGGIHKRSRKVKGDEPRRKNKHNTKKAHRNRIKIITSEQKLDSVSSKFNKTLALLTRKSGTRNKKSKSEQNAVIGIDVKPVKDCKADSTDHCGDNVAKATICIKKSKVVAAHNGAGSFGNDSDTRASMDAVSNEGSILASNAYLSNKNCSKDCPESRDENLYSNQRNRGRIHAHKDYDLSVIGDRAIYSRNEFMPYFDRLNKQNKADGVSFENTKAVNRNIKDSDQAAGDIHSEENLSENFRSWHDYLSVPHNTRGGLCWRESGINDINTTSGVCQSGMNRTGDTVADQMSSRIRAYKTKDDVPKFSGHEQLTPTESPVEDLHVIGVGVPKSQPRLAWTSPGSSPVPPAGKRANLALSHTHRSQPTGFDSTESESCVTEISELSSGSSSRSCTSEETQSHTRECGKNFEREEDWKTKSLEDIIQDNPTERRICKTKHASKSQTSARGTAVSHADKNKDKTNDFNHRELKFFSWVPFTFRSKKAKHEDHKHRKNEKAPQAQTEETDAKGKNREQDGSRGLPTDDRCVSPETERVDGSGLTNTGTLANTGTATQPSSHLTKLFAASNPAASAPANPRRHRHTNRPFSTRHHKPVD